jgi:hypothetical protein
MKAVRCFIFAIITMVSLAGAFSTSTFAQAPPCPAPPAWFPGTPYINGGCYNTNVTLNGHTCLVRICYCYRSIIGSYHDYYITRVQVTPAGCFGVGPTVADIIDAAGLQLIRDNPRNFPCPTCPKVELDWAISKSKCWSHSIDPITGDDIYEECSGGTGYCRTQYRVCCNSDGTKTITQSSVSSLPGTCQAGCTSLCD